MCGVAGIYDPRAEGRIEEANLAAMVRALAHRGPDQKGIYLGRDIGLAHARLSIIDLEGGAADSQRGPERLDRLQRRDLQLRRVARRAREARGHVFSTKSDTEVIVHLYEEYGTACLGHLNGQFAFAIWDAGKHRAFPRPRPGRHPAALLCDGRRRTALRLRDQGALHRSQAPAGDRPRGPSTRSSPSG